MATPAIRQATWRPWQANFVPELFSSSVRLISGQSVIGFDVAGVRGEVPRVQATA